MQPPEPIDLWLSPPFEPTVCDGKLYARGLSDNKGEIATRLTANRAHAPNEHIRLEDLGTAILLSRHVFAGLGH